MCRACSRTTCVNRPTQDAPVLIECPGCNGLGYHGDGESRVPCEACDDGHFRIEDCPKRFVGNKIARSVNMASWADKGHLPLPGGLSNQRAWFVEFMQALDSEVSKIEADRITQNSRGNRQ